ncbi:MAG TPA: UDP-glucose/GDP-mannose dehydrogenase family protein [Bacilli bacterium]
MNIACIGSGYVGSVTAAAFAATGHKVTIIDIDEARIAMIRQRKSPIYEPGLDLLIQETYGNTLFAATDYGSVAGADIVMICVGTPSRKDGSVDLRYVKQAAESVATHLSNEHFTVIANKSTVPVGTSDLVASIVEQKAKLIRGKHFAVVSNPEFLREGFALQDVFYPDRIIVGFSEAIANEMMNRLYEPIMERRGFAQFNRKLNLQPAENRTVYFATDTKSAELIKYASNAFLAVKISYVNDIARLCEAVGANASDVAAGMGLDSRIGNKFLQVSSGWGGSCFPKDTLELMMTGRKYGVKLGTVAAAIEANELMQHYCVTKLRKQLKTMNGKTVAILGLTFKANTDDVRNSQAEAIISELLEFGTNVKVHDPQGMAMFQRLYGNLKVEYCQTAMDAITHADACMLLTDWEEYRMLDWSAVRARMRNPYLLDTRNALPAAEMKATGFIYEGLGIP